MKSKVHVLFKAQEVTASVDFIFQYFYVVKISNFYFLVMRINLFTAASEQNIFQFLQLFISPIPPIPEQKKKITGLFLSYLKAYYVSIRLHLSQRDYTLIDFVKWCNP